MPPPPPGGGGRCAGTTQRGQPEESGRVDAETRLKRPGEEEVHPDHRLPAWSAGLFQQFHAAGPGEKWVSDITYLRTVGRWVYLTVVMDLFDRKVIGRALSGDMEAGHTTIPAMEMAFANRRAREGLIFHSDRGVQYCATSFRERLRER